MSESEQMGRCLSEMKVSRDFPTDHLVMADAIDRLAADVAAIKEAVCDGSVAEERDRFFAGWAAALDERDKLRAEVERLKAELPARQADGNRQATLDSSPAAPQPAGVSDEQAAMDKDRAAVQRYCAAPQPAAPAAGWLTERERHVLSSLLGERPRDPMLSWRDYDGVVRAILSRAGSPPVVEVPAMQSWEYTAHEEALAYRAAMDKAGVKWKELPRE